LFKGRAVDGLRKARRRTEHVLRNSRGWVGLIKAKGSYVGVYKKLIINLSPSVVFKDCNFKLPAL
jgi:hypothetical protein